MTEGTPREPHTRHYQHPDGRRIEVVVNDHGFVEISEELLHQFITHQLPPLTETTTGQDTNA